MLGMMDEFHGVFADRGVEVHCPEVIQTVAEEELVRVVPEFDGWIIGDDPATRRVFKAGRDGRLKAAVKWGIGVDNVDFVAAREYGIAITNTPDMFGREVADVAISYLIALARETFYVDRQVRCGSWPKPRGISLQGKTIGLVGFGDIGRNVARRALASDLNVIVYDPKYQPVTTLLVEHERWPSRVEECDFLVFACSLNQENYHMLNETVLRSTKDGVRIINVSRGGVIDERALLAALTSGKVHSAALDVFETEPIPAEHPLLGFDCCIFGSHNSSNTTEAVRKTSEGAIALLLDFLGI